MSAVPAEAGPAPMPSMVPILAVHFIGTLGFSIATPFLVFLVADLGGASWTYGLIGATFSVCQLLGSPVLGRWSDRVGRRVVLMVSQGGTLLAWLLFLVALALPVTPLTTVAGATLTIPLLVLTLARALDGATGGNISVASAYVADITREHPAQRQKAFGRMGMAASSGFVVGPALAGLLGATAWGYSAPVLAAAIAAALATVLVFGLLKEPGGRCPEGPPEDPAVVHTLGQHTKRCDRPPPEKTDSAWRHGAVREVVIGTFLIFLAFNTFYAAFPLYVSQGLGWEPSRLGIFFALLAGVMVMAQGPVLGFLSPRLSPRAVFGMGIACLIAAFLVFTQSHTALLLTGAGLFAVGNGLAWPTFQARVAEAAPDDLQGAVQGLTTSAGSLAAIIGLLAGAFLFDVLSVGLFVVAACIFVVVGLLTPLWFRSPQSA